MRRQRYVADSMCHARPAASPAERAPAIYSGGAAAARPAMSRRRRARSLGSGVGQIRNHPSSQRAVADENASARTQNCADREILNWMARNYMCWPSHEIFGGNSRSKYFYRIYFCRIDAPPLRGHRFMTRARALLVNLCYSVVVITWDFESHDRGSNPCSTSSVFRVPPLLLIYCSREPMIAIPCARQTF